MNSYLNLKNNSKKEFPVNKNTIKSISATLSALDQ